MTTDQLRELQGKITKGEWRHRSVEKDLDFDFEVNRQDGLAIAGIYQWSLGTSEANAQAISLVPDLMDRVIRYEEALTAIAEWDQGVGVAAMKSIARKALGEQS